MSTKEKKTSKSKDKKEKSVDKSKLDKSESKKKDKKEKKSDKDKDAQSQKSALSEQAPEDADTKDLLPPPPPVFDHPTTPPPQPVVEVATVPEFPDNKFCVHHQSELIYFCESCEEAICRNCTKLGPHNNQLHRINTLSEAFNTRVEKLREVIQGNLVEKRDSVLAQIHRIEYRIEEIKYVKQIIERDARGEFNGIVERLKTAEGQKLAILQHEMGELQKDLDRINALSNTFHECTSPESNPIDFLIRARKLYENIEFLVAKPFKVNIDVYPYDLPRELTEMRLQLQKASAQQALVDFKNEIIWKVMEERKEGEQAIKQKMEQAAAAEINQWAELTDKISNELKTCQLICYYCGAAMEEKIINKKCSENLKVNENIKGFTIKSPGNKFDGNRRHYFARPKADYIDLANIQRVPGGSHGEGQSPIVHFIGVQMNLLKNLCAEKGIDLVKVFSEHDKAGQGILNSIQFQYIMTQIIGLSPGDVEQIRRFFNAAKYTNAIDFTNILRVLDDPTQIEQMYLEQQSQQQQN